MRRRCKRRERWTAATSATTTTKRSTSTATTRSAFPTSTVKNIKVEATSAATFVAAGGLEINALTATTTYENQRIEFKTNAKEKTRELDATGSVILHPDHQEIHLPELAIRTQGVEWRTVPGSNAAIQYGASRHRAREHQARERRPVARHQRCAAVEGRRRGDRQDQRARPQRRPAAARNAAAAEPGA